MDNYLLTVKGILKDKVGYRRLYFIGVFLFGAFFMVQTRLNYNKNHMGIYESDEYHTVYTGLQLLYEGKVECFRAMGSTRWLVRAAYPYALVHLNKTMGGNVFFKTWKYPGHNYIRKHIQGNFQPNMNNPNLRDFMYGLRFFYVILVFLSFVPLLFYAYSRNYYILPVGILFFLGINMGLLKEQSIFYIEPAIIIGTNLMIAYFVYQLRNNKPHFLIPLAFGLLGAFMFSTKFSTLFFLALPFYDLFRVKKYASGYSMFGHFMVLCASFIGFFMLINLPAFFSLEAFNTFIHDVSSNFFNYATGGNFTVQPGFQHFATAFPLFLSLAGYLIFLLPILLILGIKWGNHEERGVLIGATLPAAIAFLVIFQQWVYISRNYMCFFHIILFAIFFSLEIILKKGTAGTEHTLRNRVIAVLIAGGMGLLGIQLHSEQGLGERLKTLTRRPKYLAGNELKRLCSLRPKAPVVVVSLPKEFVPVSHHARLARLPETPVLNAKALYGYTQKVSKVLKKDHIVVVHREGANKQLTNFMLPAAYNRNYQFGNYFIFYNDEQKVVP